MFEINTQDLSFEIIHISNNILDKSIQQDSKEGNDSFIQVNKKV